MTTLTLLDKKYDGESLYDVARDVHEAFDSRFTPAMAQVPKDEHGFAQGTFTIHITWEPDQS